MLMSSMVMLAGRAWIHRSSACLDVRMGTLEIGRCRKQYSGGAAPSWSTERRLRRAPAAAASVTRGENSTGGEGENGGQREDQQLTRNTTKVVARPGELGRRW